MSACKIIEDSPDTVVRPLSYEDEYGLNYQTGFNRSIIETAERCGCFHCGSIFAGSDVHEWMVDEGYEDTAVCPHCGCDAVIVGTEERPLTTALLSQLYREWFKTEYIKKVNEATAVPPFTDEDDYLRKGIPFLPSRAPDVRVLTDVKLQERAVFRKESWGGPVSVKADYHAGKWLFPVAFVCDFDPELALTPWRKEDEDAIKELIKEYGPRLRGVVASPWSDEVKLFVETGGC